MNKKKSPILKGLILLGAALVLQACSMGSPVQPTVAQVAAETVVAPTATLPPVEPAATSTPTPQPQKVILVVPAGSESMPLQAVEQALTELASGTQMTLERRDSLQASDLAADVAVTVWMAAPANLNELAAAAPQTVFLVVSAADLQPGANLSVIRVRPEYQAFVGGFIAALLSPNWRAAGLLPSDGVLGAQLQDAFVNGGRYFCGVCAPGWPLGEYYPQAGVLPGASDGAAWQGQAAALFDGKKVDAFYLSAEASKNEVYDYLAGKDQFGTPVRLVGAVAPPETLKAQWAATVRFDVAQALQQVWPDVAAGKGGASMDAPLALADVSPENLGDGRLRLVEELMQEIAAGRIYPYSVPAE